MFVFGQAASLRRLSGASNFSFANMIFDASEGLRRLALVGVAQNSKLLIHAGCAACAANSASPDLCVTGGRKGRHNRPTSPTRVSRGQRLLVTSVHFL